MNILSALKMDAVYFSETLVYTYRSTGHDNPEEHHQAKALVV
jgi:hypothetical protein